MGRIDARMDAKMDMTMDGRMEGCMGGCEDVVMVLMLVVSMFDVARIHCRSDIGIYVVPSSLVVWMCVLTLPVKVEVGLESSKGILIRQLTSGIIEVGGIDVRSGASFIDVCIEVVRSDVCIDVVCIDVWH